MPGFSTNANGHGRDPSHHLFARYGEQDRRRAEEDAAARLAAEAAAAKAAAQADADKILAEAEAEKKRILAEARAKAERIAAEEAEHRKAAQRVADVEAYKLRMQEEALAAARRAAENEAAERRRKAEAEAAARRKVEMDAAAAKEAAEQAAAHAEMERLRAEQQAVALAQKRLELEAQAQAQAARREAAARLVQRWSRAMLERARVRSSPEWAALVRVREDRVVAAALRCQAVFRGFVGRRLAREALEEQQRRHVQAEAYKQRMVQEAEERVRMEQLERREREEAEQRRAADAAEAAEAARAAEAEKRQRVVNLMGFSLAGAISADAKRATAAADIDTKSDAGDLSAAPRSGSGGGGGVVGVVDATGVGPLPPNSTWTSTLDTESNHYYYTNNATQEVTWDRPLEAELGLLGADEDESTVAASTLEDDETVDAPGPAVLFADHGTTESSHPQGAQTDASVDYAYGVVDGGSVDGGGNDAEAASAHVGALPQEAFEVPMETQEAAVAALEEMAAALRALQRPQDITAGLLGFDRMIVRASAPTVLGPSHKKIIEARAAARSLQIVARIKSMHADADDVDDGVDPMLSDGDSDDGDDDDDESDSFDDLGVVDDDDDA